MFRDLMTPKEYEEAKAEHERHAGLVDQALRRPSSNTEAAKNPNGMDLGTVLEYLDLAPASSLIRRQRPR